MPRLERRIAAGDPTYGPSELPVTGGDVMRALGLAALVTAAGVALVWARRRRHAI